MPLQVVMNLVTVEWKIYKSAIQKCNDNVQLATLLPHIHILVSASVNALGYELRLVSQNHSYRHFETWLLIGLNLLNFCSISVFDCASFLFRMSLNNLSKESVLPSHCVQLIVQLDFISFSSVQN